MCTWSFYNLSCFDLQTESAFFSISISFIDFEENELERKLFKKATFDQSKKFRCTIFNALKLSVDRMLGMIGKSTLNSQRR